MSGTPSSIELLKKLVGMAGDSPQKGYVLALDGQGLAELPTTLKVGSQVYSVCRQDTELGLRRAIWKSNGAPLVVVIPQALEVRLSRDVLRRARGSRVLKLDLSEVLSTALGIPLSGSEDSGTLQLAFQNLERLLEVVRKRTLPTLLDRQLLDELLLEVCIEPTSRIRTEEPGAILARWLKDPPRWEEALLRLVIRLLPRLHGTEGRLLAWSLQGDRRCQSLFIHGVLLDIEGERAPAVWGDLIKASEETRLSPETVRRTASGLALKAVGLLREQASSLLKEAETLANRLLPEGVLLQSTVLPLSLETHCRQVAQALSKGQRIPVERLSWMRNHRAAFLKQRELTMLEEMARLVRYLGQPELDDSATIPEQIDAYQTHGAFADVSAARIRQVMAASSSYHTEIERLLVRYRERRDQENLRFARALKGGYVEALSRSDGVTPLHRLWVDLGLAQDKTPLFLVVLDGCSYPVFLELLEGLAAAQTKQLAGIGLKTRKDSRALGLQALSLLPTVTSHARGAIFLGESPHDPLAAETLWKETGERVTDPGRFQQNKSLGTRARKLFLKGDLSDGVGPLLGALSDPLLPVVAVVFNAIDDQIGSSNTGSPMRVQPDQITGFLPSLEAAFDAGRKVLVTADHGHSPFWGKNLRVGSAATPRYCPLNQDDPVPEGFLEIDLGSLNNDTQRKAFAYRVGVYQGNQQVGFHGGCSLEEMVVPLAWLVPGGLVHDRPLWWHSDVSTPEAAPAVSPPSAPQQALPFEQPPLAPLGLPVAVEAGLVEEERQALRLLAQFKVLTASEMAKKLGKPAGRFSGWMTKLNKKLHDRGAACFRAETLPTGELQYTFLPPTKRDTP